MNQPDDVDLPLRGLAPQLDLRSIEFPSDKIALGAIRQHHRHDFDTLGVNFFDGDRLRDSREDVSARPLAEMLYIERRIAQDVYEASVRGDRTPGFLGRTSVDERGFVDDLVTHYKVYGLAKGPHEARQLIESIESQAGREARRFKQVIRGKVR